VNEWQVFESMVLNFLLPEDAGNFLTLLRLLAFQEELCLVWLVTIVCVCACALACVRVCACACLPVCEFVYLTFKETDNFLRSSVEIFILSLATTKRLISHT
jgi:hypothetical protein